MTTIVSIAKWAAAALAVAAFVKLFVLPWGPPLYTRYRAWVTRTASGMTPKG